MFQSRSNRISSFSSKKTLDPKVEKTINITSGLTNLFYWISSALTEPQNCKYTALTELSIRGQTSALTEQFSQLLK